MVAIASENPSGNRYSECAELLRAELSLDSTTFAGQSRYGWGTIYETANNRRLESQIKFTF